MIECRVPGADLPCFGLKLKVSAQTKTRAKNIPLLVAPITPLFLAVGDDVQKERKALRAK